MTLTSVDPLATFERHHRELERHLGVLCSVVRNGQGQRLVSRQRAGLARSLRYLVEGMPHHNKEEEELLSGLLHVCPRLQPMLKELRMDHVELANICSRVVTLCNTWLEQRSVSRGEVIALEEQLQVLQRLSRKHIHAEETNVLPTVRGFLGGSGLRKPQHCPIEEE